MDLWSFSPKGDVLFAWLCLLFLAELTLVSNDGVEGNILGPVYLDWIHFGDYCGHFVWTV